MTRALALAALALLAPLAAAYPNHAYPCEIHTYDGVCFGDEEYGASSCGDWGTYDGVTGVAVMFDGRYFLDVGAFHLCDTSETGDRQVHGVYVESATVTFAWTEESCWGDTYCEAEGCSWWLWVGTASARRECPMAPPRAEWGRLLP